MRSMLAIARPNPKRGGESSMLVKRSSVRRNGAKTLSQLMAESRSNPKKRRSRKKATTRRKARRNETAKTLSELLAESRSNPKRRRKTAKRKTAARRNETAKTLSELLEESRSNPKRRRKAAKRKTAARRKNPASAEHKALIAGVDAARDRLIRARAKYEQSGRAIDKANLARAEKQLQLEENKVSSASRKLSAALKSLKSSSAKAQAAKKTKKTAKKASRRNENLTAVENPRKKKRSAAKTGSSQNTDAYKKLRSTASKTRFTLAYNKAFQAAKRRGLNAASAHRSAIAAGRAAVKSRSASKKRKNPAPVKAAPMRLVANPKKKSRARKVSSVKTGSAQNTAAYKKLRSTPSKTRFTLAFNKAFKAAKKRGLSAADAHRRATAAGSAAARRSATRKNPILTRSATATARKNAPKRARAKRIRRGMSKQAEKVLGSYGPYSVSYMRDGKVVTIRAQKSSSEYRNAKSKGLSGIYRSLSGKKNTPTSLNLRSVYTVHKGDKPSKAQMQKALNVWAGALDGGKIRGVSKSDIRKTARSNPRKNALTHTVGRRNPAPMGFVRTRANESAAQVYGVGALSGVTSLYLSNLVSSSLGLGLNISAQDKLDGSVKYYAAEILPLAGVGAVFGSALYRKYSKGEMLSEKNTAMAVGAIAGSLYSALARLVFQKTLGKLPGLSALSDAVGDNYTYVDLESSSDTDEAVPTAERYALDNQNRELGLFRGGMGLMRRNGNHMNRYVKTTGRYVSTNGANHMSGVMRRANGNHTGRYVESAGRYVESAGTYRAPTGMVDGLGRRNPAVINPNIGGDVQTGPTHSIFEQESGSYNIAYDRRSLRSDIDLVEGLTPAELREEGIADVIDYGDSYKIVRATPDVARQIVEANFGSILGQSQVVQGSILVVASIYDSPQNPVLSDRLRLGTAPVLPKGASHPYAGGVFSRTANSAIFPSIDSAASFQEFGVRV